ncbi:hypothetical protein [Candidatus Phytoplasma bonamiae]|uniref:Transmembrane protein n=1 Tax=Candidatus Phytoplasma bonamiae TaxID=2982626 RepID=A0ABT9D8D0_9MOLU|nr:hypothetical protein ['Bonamia sp.' little leaf phytoplasma]MDO8064261.1 hypothetical protein ['Bonamia sp.' little leaf phytoplasma]MDV3174858.1 hypothetical protein ['Bonamia sp.' little leaf phytoplasma]
MLLFVDNLQYISILNLLLVVIVIIIVIINFFRKRKIFNKCYMIRKEINKIAVFLSQMTQEQKQQSQYSKWALIINDKSSEMQKYLLSHTNNSFEILAKILILSNLPVLFNCINQVIWKMFIFSIFFIIPCIFEIINHFAIIKYRKKFQESYLLIKQISEDIENKQDSQNIKQKH